jgi:hypothetical protein
MKLCDDDIKLYFDQLMCSRLMNTERTEDRFRTTQSVVMFTASPITKFRTLCCHDISSSNKGQNISLLYHETGQHLHQLSLNQLADVHGNAYDRHVN